MRVVTNASGSARIDRDLDRAASDAVADDSRVRVEEPCGCRLVVEPQQQADAGQVVPGVGHLERVRGHGQLSRSAAQWGDRAEHLHGSRAIAGSPLPT